MLSETKGFKAFRQSTPVVEFSNQQTQKYTDYEPNSAPTGIPENVLEAK